MMMKNILPKVRQFNPVSAILIAVLAGLTGYLVLRTLASGSFTSITLSGAALSGVTVGADPNAYGGHFIQFGPDTVPPPTPTPSPSAFAHPGVLLSKSQLDLVKSKIAAGAQPWATAFNTMKSSRYASLTWTPAPVQYVECGSNNNPNIGCTAETDDAIAAYTDSLLWYYTGQSSYAQKAIQIMNAWSSTLIDHKFDTTTYTNGLLQSAWAAEIFTRPAEIIRYSNAGWATSDIARFENMLNTAYLPHVINGWTGGQSNWLMSMADATIDIGVFTNNVSVFNTGVATWKAQLPSVIYLTSDGSQPKLPVNTSVKNVASYWYSPTSYVNGQEQEACRDITHTQMGLEAVTNAAETARIQGTDLYNDATSNARARLTAAYELAASDLNVHLNGQTISGWECPNAFTSGGTGWQLGWEEAYNEYANRLGVAMPQTLALINRLRPTSAGLHMDWETLTFAGN